ncbi:uncharacterized protein TrAtP1_007492 [Trichoderma atroviride]|nr:hypothetical protein TrAtP1_007492 [Trichoderma atroviride]
MAEILANSIVASTDSQDVPASPSTTGPLLSSSVISDGVNGKPQGIEEELLKLKEKLALAEANAEKEKQQRESLETQLKENTKQASGDDIKGLLLQVKNHFTGVDERTQDETYSLRRKIYEIGGELEYIEALTGIVDTASEERDNLRNTTAKLQSYCNMLRDELQNARPGDRILTFEEITENEDQEENAKTGVFNDGLMVDLNPMDWKMFKFPHTPNQLESRYFVIDISIEEPVITFDDYTNPWFARRTLPPQESTVGVVATAEKSLSTWKEMIDGSDPSKQVVPERIRIRSKYIIDILREIFQVKPKPYDGNSGVVMVRPYRALVHYDKEIRTKYRELGEAILAKSKEEPEGENPEENENEKQDASETKDAAEDGSKDEHASSLTAYQHLGCLIQFMDRVVQAKINYLSQPSGLRTIAFKHIWYLFKPGDTVVGQGQQQVYRVMNVTSTGHLVTPPWRNWKKDENSPVETITLHCVYIDFDGKQLGPVTQTFTIEKFDGEKAITALDAYPIRFAVAGHHIRNGDTETGEMYYTRKLVERGKVFVDVAHIKHMHYNGFALETRDEVDSQVMIDFAEAFAVKDAETAAANAMNESAQVNSWQPRVESIIGRDLGQSSSSDDKDAHSCLGACCKGDYVYADAYIEKKRYEEYAASIMPDPEELNVEPPVAIHPRSLKELTAAKDSLTDDDFLIMPYRVFGFVLRSRKWAKLDLKYLTPVDEVLKKKTAFDQLVLPTGHKDIVHCLVAQHFRDKAARVSDNEEVDIVRGKGKGLIILLHGAPGVGKTTTAEGVAERFNKPLFQITCGDLGTTASEVETALERNFSLANRWGSILLLDEADVFLAQRSPKNFIRNGLVAVFLRVLEYYAGILFLTTNRIGDFDEAFASRIHVSLYYPPLDLKSTRKIFKLNLRLIKERFQEKNRSITINKKQILNYASDYWQNNEKMRWNGRQIRNACQTALAIAEFDAQRDAAGDDDAKDAQVTLSDGHINTVFSAYLEFMRYLKNIYGKDADRVAKDMGIRAREAAIARLADDDDSSSDSDDDDKPKNKGKEEAQPPSTPPQALTSPTIPFLDNKIPAMAETTPSPNMPATTNGSPTPSSSAAAGHYQLSSGQPHPHPQAPNPYMVPNGYPANGPPPTFYPPLHEHDVQPPSIHASPTPRPIPKHALPATPNASTDANANANANASILGTRQPSTDAQHDAANVSHDTANGRSDVAKHELAGHARRRANGLSQYGHGQW